jgi:hypothetical protein
MKCIHCHNDAKYKDRSDGKCPTCHRMFAFEPKTGDPLTDVAFDLAIDRVSSSGTVKWTERHLYYEIVKQKKKKTAVGVVFLMLAGLFVIIAIVGQPAFLIGAVIAAAISVSGFYPRRLSLTPDRFDELYRRWVAAHGPPTTFVMRRKAPKAPRALPADIPEYSFDRAVICDRPETADLLLANNFHFENNCAVLSVDGYPPEVFPTVRAMLRKNPKLVVYALHDATLAGCTLAKKLRSPDWFATAAKVVDVGLTPAHAKRWKGVWQRHGSFVGRSADLTREENDWLATYFVELAVIRPEQVIKRLFRAISGTPEPLTAEAGIVLDSSSFSTDATVSDGGGDAFG